MKESRQSERTAHDAPKQGKAPGKSGEYTVDEMRRFLEEMSGKYDLARVVDPIECRILDFQNDGRIGMKERCYGIWNAEQKCVNCSSALACRTGCHQEKAERFQDEVYFIQSNPVSLKLADGSVFDAVVELVNIEKDSTRPANDREAENIGGRAAGYLAQHDSLTNVLNAEAFYELGRTRIQNSPERAWVMVTGNIMNFRLVNNLFGVARGNEVLVRTAAMLREISEKARGLCGRLGGDQFAMLLPGSRFREEDLSDTARFLGEVFNSGLFTFCIHFGVYRVEDPAIPVSVMCGRANSALRTI
ncbi:MAG: diguanylate cyclase, partial [Oscillospiraceae bacterium]|nr:diguanylate cyclase [Oscillospiraceae bacterium]